MTLHLHNLTRVFPGTVRELFQGPRDPPADRRAGRHRHVAGGGRALLPDDETVEEGLEAFFLRSTSQPRCCRLGTRDVVSSRRTIRDLLLSKVPTRPRFKRFRRGVAESRRLLDAHAKQTRSFVRSRPARKPTNVSVRRTTETAREQCDLTFLHRPVAKATSDQTRSLPERRASSRLTQQQSNRLQRSTKAPTKSESDQLKAIPVTSDCSPPPSGDSNRSKQR